MKKTFIPFLILFLCWTCMGFEGCVPGTSFISGTVTDSDGNPIEGAVVRFVPEYSGLLAEFDLSTFTAAITDSDGYYETLCPAGIIGIEEIKAYAIKRDYEVKSPEQWEDIDRGLFISFFFQHEQTINFSLAYEKWTSSGVVTGRILSNGEPNKYDFISTPKLALPTRNVDNLREVDKTIVYTYDIQGGPDNTGIFRFENVDYGRYEFWPYGNGSYKSIEIEIWPNNPVVDLGDIEVD